MEILGLTLHDSFTSSFFLNSFSSSAIQESNCFSRYFVSLAALDLSISFVLRVMGTVCGLGVFKFRSRLHASLLTNEIQYLVCGGITLQMALYGEWLGRELLKPKYPLHSSSSSVPPISSVSL